MQSPTTHNAAMTGAIGLAVAGSLLGLGGVLHPRVDAGLDFEQGLAGMFESPLWTASHLLTMGGYLALAISLATLVRAQERAWTRRLRVVAWVAVTSAVIATAESLPHLLAASDADALRRGEEATLANLHTDLQVFSTPALGLSVVALAVVGARTRGLDGGTPATVIAVLGGLAFALAGPVIAFSENSDLSPLFAGAAGIAIWAVAAGARTTHRLKQAPAPVRNAGQGRDLAPVPEHVR